jgi:hypothetical protein
VRLENVVHSTYTEVVHAWTKVSIKWQWHRTENNVGMKTNAPTAPSWWSYTQSNSLCQMKVQISPLLYEENNSKNIWYFSINIHVNINMNILNIYYWVLQMELKVHHNQKTLNVKDLVSDKQENIRNTLSNQHNGSIIHKIKIYNWHLTYTVISHLAYMTYH